MVWWSTTGCLVRALGSRAAWRSLFHPDLYPRVGNFVQLSQEEIGLLSGVSRQRTNEALHELERPGLLRVKFGGVTVLDLSGLHAYSGAQAGTSARAA